MKCEGCGAINPEGMKFCGNCGRPLVVPSAGPPDTRTRNCVNRTQLLKAVPRFPRSH